MSFAHSERFIADHKKTIDEIVFDSGFSNKVTFFKVFREKYECTPKEFRMKHLEEVQQ